MVENAIKQHGQHLWSQAAAGKGNSDILKRKEEHRKKSMPLMRGMAQKWIEQQQEKFKIERDAYAKKRGKDKDAVIHGKEMVRK